MSEGRILSIQSHVVAGYVGNKCATFPLQTLGFEVDAINSVQLSNHTGYTIVKGQILNEKNLDDLISGLIENSLHDYSHLLTGYVGSPTFLTEISKTVGELRKKNPKLVYVCDPVMGDNGRMYVPESLLEIYKTCIIPLADIITPNHYELELLTGKPVKSIQDAWVAIDKLHDKGCKTVVISSTDLGTENTLLAIASSKTNGKRERILMNIPLLDANFTGTGDLFTALFLAWMTKTGNNLQLSLEKTIDTEQAILKRTLSRAKSLAGAGNKPSREHLELRLIESKRDIENPETLCRCEVIE
ncbi:pyridoxal kinase [Nilaparvata lugens]|uniref:pyridoxal kinase n=1 Tax=Nilaparvata lugens TaxID=108931 RepID=UPI00193E3D7F|nr:pyridoxal kinase [Nilaparvata lugens]